MTPRVPRKPEPVPFDSDESERELLTDEYLVIGGKGKDPTS